MPGVAGLRFEQVREALQLLGQPSGGVPAAAQSRLSDTLLAAGSVRGALADAPHGAREAFDALVRRGPTPVRELLGRGWWGHGVLPPPLDWLQVRALVEVTDDGRVAATDEARDGYLHVSSAPPPPAPAAAGVRVEPVGAVVVAATAEALDRVVGVPGARLRAVAPTVALSELDADAVTSALRAAGVALVDDVAVAAQPTAPALPGSAEDAVGPRAIRALLERALAEQRQVRLQYFASSRGGAATDRVVDPWTFRDDLLRGYCHLREGERTFAVDRIGRLRLLPAPLRHLP